ncbi:MAG TPA: hypothetical protein VMF03_02745 [Steroidobacteraceae bacterium]|nr:hypothetical protein [Steroidobacteraceae bacterium]
MKSQCLPACFVGCLMGVLPVAQAAAPLAARVHTATPIEHLIVIVGENISFDGLFATYRPRRGTVRNLLSEGVIRADGSPGPRFDRARQRRAVRQVHCRLDPQRTGPDASLPHQRLIGVQNRNLQLVRMSRTIGGFCGEQECQN